MGGEESPSEPRLSSEFLEIVLVHGGLESSGLPDAIWVVLPEEKALARAGIALRARPLHRE